jgi:hypothetical protein
MFMHFVLIKIKNHYESYQKLTGLFSAMNGTGQVLNFSSGFRSAIHDRQD